MKRTFLVAMLMMTAAILSVRLFAQTNRSPRADIPTAKIAVIDSTAFGDETQGIKRYVAATKVLEREFKGKTSEADKVAFRKRYDEIVGTVAQDIGRALDQFAADNGITLTLDVGKMESAVVTVNPKIDVTASFVADYNSKHPVTTP